MRKFYEFYPIWSAVPTELSWSHFQELIRIDRKEERDFYDHDKDIINLKYIWEKFKKIKVPFYSYIGNRDLRSMSSRKEVEEIMEYIIMLLVL